MGNRVVDFRIDTVSVSAEQYSGLPRKVRELFEVFWEKPRVSAGVLTFEIAIYRWNELREFLPDGALTKIGEG